MIVGGSGRVVHHNDCTFCRNRLKVPTGAKKGVKEIERCSLTNQNIPAPYALGDRYCNRYSQIGCECDQCNGEMVTSETGTIAIH
jgi:hypothetical protein